MIVASRVFVSEYSSNHVHMRFTIPELDYSFEVDSFCGMQGLVGLA